MFKNTKVGYLILSRYRSIDLILYWIFPSINTFTILTTYLSIDLILYWYFPSIKKYQINPFSIQIQRKRDLFLSHIEICRSISVGLDENTFSGQSAQISWSGTVRSCWKVTVRSVDQIQRDLPISQTDIWWWDQYEYVHTYCANCIFKP